MVKSTHTLYHTLFSECPTFLLRRLQKFYTYMSFQKKTKKTNKNKTLLQCNAQKLIVYRTVQIVLSPPYTY